LRSEFRADSFGLAPEGKISIAYGTLSVAIQDSAERARAKFLAARCAQSGSFRLFCRSPWREGEDLGEARSKIFGEACDDVTEVVAVTRATGEELARRHAAQGSGNCGARAVGQRMRSGWMRSMGLRTPENFMRRADIAKCAGEVQNFAADLFRIVAELNACVPG
jgi:hypothetical protein